MLKAASDLGSVTLDYGETVTFGTSGSVSRLASHGFDLGDGEHHSWTQKSTAYVEFGLRLPTEPIVLRIDAVPFLSPTVVHQQFFVYMNGLFLGFSNLREPVMMTFEVDRSVISSRHNRLSFVVPTAVTPVELGLGDDRRQLGIALISLTFAAGSA